MRVLHEIVLSIGTPQQAHGKWPSVNKFKFLYFSNEGGKELLFAFVQLNVNVLYLCKFALSLPLKVGLRE